MNPKTTGILFVIAAVLAAFVYFYEIGGEQERQNAEEAEKRLFPAVEADAIESISLWTSDSVEVRIQRSEGVWRIVEPVDFAAEPLAADGLASTLAQLISETVIEDPQPPEVYGLDDGERIVRFSAGEVEHVLHTGNDTPVGASAYASVGGAEKVFTVESHRVRSLRKGFDDLRNKRIANFDDNAVRGFTASWPDGRVVAERSDAGWRLTVPLEGPADEYTIDRLLTDLSFLRANGFVDDPTDTQRASLDRPEFAIELTLSSEDEGSAPASLKLAIGALSEDASHRLVRGSEKSLYTIAAERLDDFPRTTSKYRFRQLAKFSPRHAARIELGFDSEAGESRVVTATRSEEGWTSSPDAIEAGQLDGLVRELSNLRADDILADSMGSDELRAVGFDPPASKIVIFGAGEGSDAERLAEVHFGNINSAGIPVRIPGSDTTFQLDPALAEFIPVNLDAYTNHFIAKEDPAAPDEDTDDTKP